MHRSLLAAALLVWSSAGLAQTTSANNTLTQKERARGWRLLFDGTDLNGWRGYQSQGVPAGWTVNDGELRKSGSVGDLMTKDKFRNFDLKVDWKIAPGGNAGIFYRATEEYDHIYWSGPEYQLLDDARHPDGKSRLTSAGADYALYPSPAGIVKRADEWNHTEIIVRGHHVEHWMNGRKLLSYELGSRDWKKRVAASKFGAYPNYGRATEGYIGIQGDHDGALAIRNVKIRELK